MTRTPDPTPAGAKRTGFLIALVVLTLCLFEAGSLAVLVLLRSMGWIAYIPSFSEQQMTFYLTERDRVLGWAFVSESTWGPATDATGRITRPFPRPDPSPVASGAPCVSTYGDSFVYGTEAEHDETYPHYLSELLQCAVRNYGVPGFGSDQSVMLFRAQVGADSAPVVVFQHLTENVLRNVNRYANLLYPGSPLRFKPRFILNADGSIAYLPAPVQSREDFARVTANPDSALRPDALLDRARPGFPFTVSMLRWLATDMKIRARMTGVPTEAALYDPSHPAGGFALTAAILQTGVREAAADGRRGVVVLQTTRQGLIHARETGRWMDQALGDTLLARGVPTIHAGPRILAALDGRDPCSLFNDCAQTHLNAAGNRIVARIIADYLREAGLAPSPAPVTRAVGADGRASR